MGRWGRAQSSEENRTGDAAALWRPDAGWTRHTPFQPTRQRLRQAVRSGAYTLLCDGVRTGGDERSAEELRADDVPLAANDFTHALRRNRRLQLREKLGTECTRRDVRSRGERLDGAFPQDAT